METQLSKFFNLERDPFGETPDTKFFFENASHQDALTGILSFVESGKGFGLLTGEVGTGKTLLSRLILKSLEDRASTALILFPKLGECELLQAICEEFEIPDSAPWNEALTTKTYLDRLNEFLLDENARGRRCVLLIDEAQGLSLEALEAIRLLSNLETEREKLLQIIILGQPELRARLAEPELRQFTQRIGLSRCLDPLSQAQTERYIKHRLNIAGRANLIRFDPKVMPLIYRATGGVPREINRVCSSLIQAAFHRRIRLLDHAFVKPLLTRPTESIFARLFRSPRNQGAAL